MYTDIHKSDLDLQKNIFLKSNSFKTTGIFEEPGEDLRINFQQMAALKRLYRQDFISTILIVTCIAIYSYQHWTQLNIYIKLLIFTLAISLLITKCLLMKLSKTNIYITAASSTKRWYHPNARLNLRLVIKVIFLCYLASSSFNNQGSITSLILEYIICITAALLFLSYLIAIYVQLKLSKQYLKENSKIYKLTWRKDKIIVCYRNEGTDKLIQILNSNNNMVK